MGHVMVSFSFVFVRMVDSCGPRHCAKDLGHVLSQGPTFYVHISSQVCIVVLIDKINYLDREL